jgi:hypothetical protein
LAMVFGWMSVLPSKPSSFACAVRGQRIQTANQCFVRFCQVGRALPHERRPYHTPFALHPARHRPSTPSPAAQTAITRSAAAKNYCLRPTGRIGLCSEDFLGTYLDSERLTTDAPLESAKKGQPTRTERSAAADRFHFYPSASRNRIRLLTSVLIE